MVPPKPILWGVSCLAATSASWSTSSRPAPLTCMSSSMPLTPISQLRCRRARQGIVEQRRHRRKALPRRQVEAATLRHADARGNSGVSRSWRRQLPEACRTGIGRGSLTLLRATPLARADGVGDLPDDRLEIPAGAGSEPDSRVNLACETTRAVSIWELSHGKLSHAKHRQLSRSGGTFPWECSSWRGAVRACRAGSDARV